MEHLGTGKLEPQGNKIDGTLTICIGLYVRPLYKPTIWGRIRCHAMYFDHGVDICRIYPLGNHHISQLKVCLSGWWPQDLAFGRGNNGGETPFPNDRSTGMVAPTGSFFWCFKSSNLLMAPKGHRLRRYHVVILHRGVVKTTTTTATLVWKSKKRAPNNGGFVRGFPGMFFWGDI